MTAPLWLRRLLRPLIPDRWMARRRIHEHSLGVRHNVDIVVADGSRAKLWLDTTPDTYRVRDPGQFGDAPSARFIDPQVDDEPTGDDDVVIVGGPLSEHLAETLTRPLSDQDLAAAVLGEVAEPRLVDRRRVEPIPAPTAIAVRSAVWREVDGAPAGARRLAGLLHRLRDAGHHLALVPAAPAGTSRTRSDPITPPAAVVFSLVPLHDVGGGSRSTQLALELLRRGYHVTFVWAQPASHAVDLGLRFVHPRLEQARLAEFDSDTMASRMANVPPLVIAGLPSAGVMSATERLQASGASIVYDCMDDWSSPWLGGGWYDETAERRLAHSANAVVAAAPDLVARMESFDVAAALVPNGVDPNRFAGAVEQDPPADFPQGSGRVLGYHGSLHGGWMDWEGMWRLAAERPGDRLVLVGDPPDPPPATPPNVHFIGLKPHGELASYVAAFDVGLVPFLVDPATHAASPLKVYEYLAAGVPVAAPPLRSLAGIAGVATDTDLVAAVAQALAGSRPDAGSARAEHAWGRRVESLLAAAGVEPPASITAGARVVQRPVVHYAKSERRGRER